MLLYDQDAANNATYQTEAQYGDGHRYAFHEGRRIVIS